MSTDLSRLPPRDDSGALHVVIETPAASRVKLKYAPELGAFVVSRPLVLGVVYPFDWGFVPGTHAPDGDPVDALVLADTGTFPGVVVSCRPLAVLRVEQNAKQGGRQRNDRLVVEPLSARRHTALDERIRRELECFFVAATALEDKDLRYLGWGDASAADALIRDASPRG